MLLKLHSNQSNCSEVRLTIDLFGGGIFYRRHGLALLAQKTVWLSIDFIMVLNSLQVMQPLLACMLSGCLPLLGSHKSRNLVQGSAMESEIPVLSTFSLYQPWPLVCILSFSSRSLSDSCTSNHYIHVPARTRGNGKGTQAKDSNSQISPFW